MSEWTWIEEYVTKVCNALQMVERMKNCVNCDHYRVCGRLMSVRRAGDYSACESWKLADEGPAANERRTGGEGPRTAPDGVELARERIAKMLDAWGCGGGTKERRP